MALDCVCLPCIPALFKFFPDEHTPLAFFRLQSLSRQVHGSAHSDKLEHSTLAGPPTSTEKKEESDRLSTVVRVKLRAMFLQL